MDENCGNCRFWNGIYSDDTGACRRYPPTSHEKRTIAGGFECQNPRTGKYHWCGEWGERSK